MACGMGAVEGAVLQRLDEGRRDGATKGRAALNQRMSHTILVFSLCCSLLLAYLWSLQ